MLEANCEQALKRVIELCRGGYTVLGADDFGEIPAIDSCISRLADGGYISLRYSANGQYLLMPVEKGLEYFSEKRGKLVYKSVLRRECAFYSFLGALAGGFCTACLFALIVAVALLVRGANA